MAVVEWNVCRLEREGSRDLNFFCHSLGSGDIS